MEFTEHFKVKAEFDTTMARTEENMQQYAAFVCTLCQKENLKHLDGSGLAKLVEHSSRLAEDQQKLSTRFAEIADIILVNFFRLPLFDVVGGLLQVHIVERRSASSADVQLTKLNGKTFAIHPRSD